MDKQSLTRLQRQLTGKYVATNGLFWMAYVCIWGFGAVYLKGKGFSSTETGIITALGGLISVVFQPLLAARMENGGRLSVRQAFMLCLGAACICDVVLLVCPAAAALALACLFLAVMALFQMNSAVLNSLGMEYVNLGIPVNYGLARGRLRLLCPAVTGTGICDGALRCGCADCAVTGIQPVPHRTAGDIPEYP